MHLQLRRCEGADIDCRTAGRGMMKPYSITRRLIATVLLIELVSALCVTAVCLPI